MTTDNSRELSKNQLDLLRRSFFDYANDAVYVFDFTDGRILDANPYVLGMLGYSREELLGLTVFDVHPDEERGRMMELLEVFAEKGQIRGISDMHLMRKDRSTIPVEKNGTLFTLDDIRAVQCTCRDITERKIFEAELNKRIEDMHILNSIALEITSGLDLDKILPSITQSTTKLLNADAGAIGLYDARKGTLSYRYIYNLPDSLVKVELSRDTGISSYVLETKRPVSIPSYPEHPKSLKEFTDAGVLATAIAPLLVENRLLGTLVITHKHPDKRFNEYDMNLLEAVARQAAIAIYNAQLFEEMKDEGDFRQALNQLTSLIGSTLDIDKVYNLICEESTRLFKNSGTYLYVVDEDKDLLVGKAAFGEKAKDFLKASVPIGEPSVASYVFHTRKPILIDDTTIHPLAKTEMIREFAVKTLMGTPIIVDGNIKSVLLFSSNEKPYFFNEVQLDRAKILSNQMAFAIKNAALYDQTRRALEHERYVALTLQKSLLPVEIPKIEGAEVGVYYAPTHVGEALVGGDFYDFIRLPDGKIALIIGDVSGKGIKAAAITAMVKYAIRSFAYKDPSPSFVLTQANNVVSIQLKAGSFVTILYALYNPKTGRLSYANAGHPYPVRHNTKRKDCILDKTDDPIFGLIADYNYSENERLLDPGDLLVLYTDGLIEARSNGEFFGTDKATESICHNSALNAQAIATILANDCIEFSKGVLVDDVAILALKRKAP